MAKRYMHCISHALVELKAVKPEKHPVDGSRTCTYQKVDGGELVTCSEEQFFNFHVAVEKLPWFDPNKKEQEVASTEEEKQAPIPPNLLRERRARGEVDTSYEEDFLPEVSINGGNGREC